MVCKTCKIFFKKRKVDKRDKNKFCSSRCALVPCRTKEHQISAAKKAGLVIIAKYRGTGKGYIKEGKQHQHRVVAEKTLGRKLKKGEIVHHIDNNPQNNNPKNLQVMTQSEHARLHNKLSNGASVKKMIAFNTKHGPECFKKKCKLPNTIGRAYCPHHQYRFEKYGEI